ncbi:MAG: 50S ribosomal protein L18 [Saprospiraceae bacterium]|nr:50S ribosomal protein L18 [Saprospiraceae bacterium]
MDLKVKRRKRIRLGIRRKIRGEAQKPRISIFRSNNNIYAQAVDDISGVTIASASSKSVTSSGKKSEVAKEVGKALGQKLIDMNLTTAVFDRSGYLYHGRVKALADGVREAGLKF